MTVFDIPPCRRLNETRSFEAPGLHPVLYYTPRYPRRISQSHYTVQQTTHRVLIQQ